MKFHDLKELLLNFEKYPGTVKVKPGPMINEGYPSNFNLSFAWYEWTNKEGIKGPNKQYVSFVGDMFYTKCQPCIRPQDWKTIIDNNQSKYRYLSYFHMSDVSGLAARIDGRYRDEISKFSIKSLINVFIKLNLDLNKVYISYCKGGRVSELTAEKYTFNKSVGRDPFYDEWLSQGIAEKNMISDSTRDTFLSLKNYSRPSPWGYRNEIFYMHNGKLLDIATVEHLVFEPVLDSKIDIVGIKDYKHAVSISAIGLERLLMVINNLDDIRKIDIINPLYKMVHEKIPDISTEDADALIQTIRPIQAIIADGGKWSSLNKKRKGILRSFYLEFAFICEKYSLNINHNLFINLLKLNADLLNNEIMKKSLIDVKEELSNRMIFMGNNKHYSIEQRKILRNVGGKDNEY